MKRLLDLNNCECRWPVHEDEDGHFFCAAPATGSYCAEHHARAFLPLSSWVDRSRGRRANGRVKGVNDRPNDALVPPIDKLFESPRLKRFEACVGREIA